MGNLSDIKRARSGVTQTYEDDRDLGIGEELSLIRGNKKDKRGRKTISAAYTSDGWKHYSADTSSSGFTLTLSSADAADGREITIKVNGANTLTIDTEGSETIDGSTSTTISSDDGSLHLIYNVDNTDWETI